MDPIAVAEALVKYGRKLFCDQSGPVVFSGDPDADRLLNDLKRHPHAFVIGCLMQRQVRAETAWLVPYRLSERLGGFSFAKLRKLSRPKLESTFCKPYSLHRLGRRMVADLHAALRIIADEYGGVASRIWTGTPSSAEVVYRFLQFPGVGPKIATMATNILARHLKVPMSDRYSIDVSPDAHVRRVFGRLGLVGEGASNEELIYRARSLHPRFPGLLDGPTWQIGRDWCRPKGPLCRDCTMQKLCPVAQSRHA